MLRMFSPRLLLAILWALLTFVSLSLRPLFPIDETRYVAVAWEMWVRGDFLVPHLNGEAYSHKPPLLFWLMQLSWWLFGVNDWSHRVIAPLFSLATLYLLQLLASTLWPGRKQIAELAPFILLGFFFWMVFGTLTMFDIMLSFFALLGIYALSLLLCSGLSYKRWLLLGAAIGGGVLTKGPVILLHVLPLALLAPWLLTSSPVRFGKKQWYSGLLLAVFTGTVLALSWAVPAGIAGGETYRNAIFLGQTSGRIVDSFAHKLPFWWYLQLLPVVLLPWLLMQPFWVELIKFNGKDFGRRFCLIWLLPVFIAFSLVSGKRIHYLLPLMPGLAVLLAWALDHVQDVNWRRAQILVITLWGGLGIILTLLPWLNESYAWRPELSELSPLWGVLPMLGATCLFFCYPRSAEETVIRVCMSAIFLALALAGGFFQIRGDRYDTTPPGLKIAALMGENRTVAFYGGKYHGQFNFAGRVVRPIQVFSSRKDLTNFAERYPEGFVLSEYKDSPDMPASLFSYSYPFKSHNIGFISCESLLKNPQIVTKLTPA